MSNHSINFRGINIYIGIDVHKNNWKIALRCNKTLLKRLSINPDPDILVNFLNNHYPNANFFAVYEAGFCGFWICHELNRKGIKCIVVNPADIPTSNKEKTHKTDPVDAAKMARELENKSLKNIYIPSVSQQQLRSLLRLRFQLVKEHTRIRNRIKSMLYFYGIQIPDIYKNCKWSNSFIQWLNNISFQNETARLTMKQMISQLLYIRNQIKDVLNQFRQLAKTDKIQPVIKSLTSVPGIGLITAMTFFAEIMDMKRFSNLDTLAAFVGLVPSVSASGDTEYDRGISRRHNPYLRPLIIEAAWIAVKADPAMTLKFAELSKTMNNKKAIIRIAKKLLHRIRYVWLNQKDYVNAIIK